MVDADMLVKRRALSNIGGGYRSRCGLDVILRTEHLAGNPAIDAT